jgi:transposase
VAAARRAWRRTQRRLDPRQLVFIDETAVATNMVRRYGRAPRGQRLVCKVPFGAWTTLTFIAALRHDRITAPLLLQGAMNGQIFRAYVEQMLAPTLKPGDVVITDNVRVHKVAGVSEAIEARGATVPSFPAYSPDLNPIELAFSKLKAHLRASTARSTPGCSPPSAPRSRASLRANAPLISLMQAIARSNRKRLCPPAKRAVSDPGALSSVAVPGSGRRGCLR